MPYHIPSFSHWDSIKYYYYVIEYNVLHSWWTIAIIAFIALIIAFFLLKKRSKKAIKQAPNASNTICKEPNNDTLLTEQPPVNTTETASETHTEVAPEDIIPEPEIIAYTKDDAGQPENLAPEVSTELPLEEAATVEKKEEEHGAEGQEECPREEDENQPHETMQENTEPTVAASEEGEGTHTPAPEYSQELIEKFQQYIIEEKGYLDPEIKVEKVASVLYSNRTTISLLVNKEYHCNFRDLINGMRISHSKEYMLSHVNATQEEVATASGFSCASAYNRKFKQMEHMAPREWLNKAANA